MPTDGDDGGLLTAALISEAANMQDNKEGLYALEDADLINLLVIPPYLANGHVDDAVVTSAIAYAEDRRAMFIMDPDPAWTVDSAVTAVSECQLHLEPERDAVLPADQTTRSSSR